MSSPRIEVDLSKIRHNTQTVVGQLKACGIGVTGVTKAVCGHPSIARAMLDGGVKTLADARLSNVQRLRKAGVTCPITLIRSPMLSQVSDVVRFCETSYNTEGAVIAALAAAATRTGTVHGVVLMVEMGDLREGIMPQDLGAMARQVMDMPGVALKGIGANFACLSGTAPDAAKMRTLSALANDIEGTCGPFLQTVSGGNSANLPWALEGHATDRINDLRLGEAILLGRDPVSGKHIAGLYKDAFTLVAEVIGTDRQAVRPPASIANPALARLSPGPTFNRQRFILALGHQDTDIFGLSMPQGHRFIGATSDHLVIGADRGKLKTGSEIRFQMNYSALMQAMAAPDVETNLFGDRPVLPVQGAQGFGKHLELV